MLISTNDSLATETMPINYPTMYGGTITTNTIANCSTQCNFEFQWKFDEWLKVDDIEIISF